MKHAYLILAHNEFPVLKLLVGCLDDERNDIFVHFDAKVSVLPELSTRKAGLHILQDRVDVRWGDFSVVQAEYALFKAAYKPGEYEYYHLLSGVDLPIKSQDYIHTFCAANSGKEFIGYTLKGITPEVVRKVQRLHLFPKHFKGANMAQRALRAGFIRLQEALGTKRNRGISFTKGSQWVSVTGEMAALFLEKEEWARKVFHHTFCSDEIIFQTLCWNSPLKENLYNTESDGAGCARCIGWREDHQLYDWAAADYGALASSPALFARKFNSSDPAFLQKIIKLQERACDFEE